ncbi:hypothetical protein ASF93_12055 [Microbacterium sp. Leaf347]|nr:hypothetical protein [Microbacterium sp. Leaf347]KQS00176.1 hypothetical protein ASF93_12055 [Microbacterium sp. Leaf347]KQS02797.1 hypothetical protein ASG00_08850 [Microbacterium sp. Leaf351]
MAVHSRHPIAAPPAAPLRETTPHLLLRAWCLVALVILVGLPLWASLLGPDVAELLLAASLVATLAIWLFGRGRLAWRRLPWAALAFVVVAATTIALSPDRATLWPAALALASAAVHGLFLASVLTWVELVIALSSAASWVLGAGLALEAWAATVLRGPLEGATGLLVSDGSLWRLGSITGGLGSPDVLAATALTGLIATGALLRARASRSGVRGIVLALQLVMFVHAWSPAGAAAALAVGLVLTTQLLMRTVRRFGGRTPLYAAYTAAAVVLSLIVVVLWPREVTIAPAWSGLWLTAGPVATVLGAAALAGAVWRSWFFGVDRPRWDIRDDRPYSALTLVPTLALTVTLIHSATSPAGLPPSAWALVVAVTFAIKRAPRVTGDAPARGAVSEQWRSR